jgi:cellulose synthase/poly-beta-1,6-N-acetylglucosamine synthase-like glycosyltransferase
MISVIVPTRDRPESLRRCLDALAVQTSLDELEVIVVDDGSALPQAVAEIVEQHSFARVVRHNKSGPAHARNAGVASARGRFVCFTDDDCEPTPLWAARLVGALEAGADAVAGCTRNADRSALAVASEIVVSAPAAPAESSNRSLLFAPSNNLGCHRVVLDSIPFDESYPAAAGEDRDWCARLIAAGYALRAEPTAVVIHHSQSTLRGYLRQQLRYGRGAYQFRARATQRRPEPPRFYARLIGRAFAGGARVGLLVCLAQVATAVGYIAEWSASRTAAAEEPPNSLRNRRHADEVVNDVQGQRGNGEGEPAPPHEHAVERVVEHDD